MFGFRLLRIAAIGVSLAGLLAGCGQGVGGPSGNTPSDSPNTQVPVKVLGVSPANGAAGVRKDAPIVVSFDGPADRAAVEASYASASEGLKPGQVEFIWNAEGTELTVKPKGGLEYATTPFLQQSRAAPIPAAPEAVIAKSYTFKLLGAAYSFKTAREITVLVPSGVAMMWNTERPSDTRSRCVGSGACFGDNEDNQEIRSVIVFDTASLRGREISGLRFFGYLGTGLYDASRLAPCNPHQPGCKFLTAELLDSRLAGAERFDFYNPTRAAFDAPSLLTRRLGVQDKLEGDNDQAFSDLLSESLRRGEERMFVRLRLDTPTNNDGVADIGGLTMDGEGRAALLVSYLDSGEASSTGSIPTRRISVVLDAERVVNHSPSTQNRIVYSCRYLVCAGDDADNWPVRALMVFDPSKAETPRGARLVDARLRVFQYNSGESFAALGSPVLERVPTEEGYNWFFSPALDIIPSESLGGSPGFKELDVREAVGEGTYPVSLRLRMSEGANRNGIAETIQFVVRHDPFQGVPEEAPKLILTYEVSADRPSPALQTKRTLETYRSSIRSSGGIVDDTTGRNSCAGSWTVPTTCFGSGPGYSSYGLVTFDLSELPEDVTLENIVGGGFMIPHNFYRLEGCAEGLADCRQIQVEYVGLSSRDDLTALSSTAPAPIYTFRFGPNTERERIAAFRQILRHAVTHRTPERSHLGLILRYVPRNAQQAAAVQLFLSHHPDVAARMKLTYRLPR